MSLTIGIGGIIDATNPGPGFTPIKGDGSDSWPALQAMADAIVAGNPKTPPQPTMGVRLQLPPGYVAVSQMLNYRQGRLALIGTDQTNFISVKGGVAGPLLGRNVEGVNANGWVSIENINFQNSHPSGTCVQLEAVAGGQIKNCHFSGNQGLIIGATGVGQNEISLYDVFFDGNSTTFPNGVGLIANIIGDLYRVVGTGWSKCCLQLAGRVGIFGAKLEENVLALATGIAPGPNAPNQAFVLAERLSMEANLIGVQVQKGTYSLKLESMALQADQYNGSIWPSYGIDIEGMQQGGVTMENCELGGSFTKSAIHIGPFATAGQIVAINCQVTNKGQAGSTLTWDPATPPANLTKIACS